MAFGLCAVTDSLDPGFVAYLFLNLIRQRVAFRFKGTDQQKISIYPAVDESLESGDQFANPFSEHGQEMPPSRAAAPRLAPLR